MQPAPTAPSPRTITVMGHGEALLAPDIAQISIGVHATAPTARAASDQVATSMRAILDVLANNGVAERDRKTSRLTLTPEYQIGTQQRVGHQAANMVIVTIRMLENLSTLLDALIDAGGDVIVLNEITFASSDPAAARDQARLAAIADARHQADLLAGAAGATLGPVQRITPGDMNAGPRMFAMASRAAMPVESGELTLTSDLEVVYALI